MKIKKLLMIVCMFIFSGCTVNKTMYASSGSKANGTIIMSYNYGDFEIPKVDINQGKQIATEKCVLWGYKNAIPFGGERRSRQADSMLVEIEFQCIN